MKLRTRFVVIMAGFVFALTCLVSMIAARVFLTRATSLENQLIREALESGRLDLEKEQEILTGLTEDWASWDDIYGFMAATNRPFLESNLADSTFVSLNLNLIAFFDTQGRPLFSKGFDLEKREEGLPPPLLWQHILASDRLIRKTDSSPKATGLISAGGEIWLVSALPILTSKKTGPSRGSLLFARRLTGKRGLKNSLRGDFAIYPCETGASAKKMAIHTSGLTTAKGNRWIADLDGNLSIMIECEIERAVFLHGLSSQFFLTGWILLCGAGTGLFVFWIVDRWVLQDLSASLDALKRGVAAVSSGADQLPRLKTSRQDEMGMVANSLNAMLEALHRSNLSLRASEEKYRTLVESAPDAILHLDAKGQIVAGNHVFFDRILGRTEDASVGQPLTEAWPGAISTSILASLSRLGEGKTATLPDLSDSRFTPERWYSASLARAGHSAHRDAYTLVVLRDETERIQAQRTAEKQRKDLIQAQKMTAMGTLVAGVAHEVNNPNTVISLNVPALLRRFNDLDTLLQKIASEPGPDVTAEAERRRLQGEIQSLIAEIRDASARIGSVVASLKTFTRPASSKMAEPVSINTVIRAAGDLLRHVIAKKQCVLRLALSDDLPHMDGNAQQLTQVMVNLIQNAAEAATHPDSVIAVASGWDTTTNTLHVTVRDQGAGIAPDNLERVFEPFFTTRREQGGTGLGLSISSEIIHAHRGRIDVRSEPGLGALFTIELPAQERDDHDT